jgi:hypothetical protein
MGVIPLKLADDFQTIQARHGNVDDGNIRQRFMDHPYRFTAVGGFRNDLHIAAFFHDTSQPGADNTMVICKQDSDQ